ncbi:MAG: VWA domain-containing protein [Thermoguttaceae bacterium]|nr:VWA domain-containing protein [Thermoguttaceae bacterium]
MLSFIFGFGLARPIFLAAIAAIIPILIWQWRSLTHFPAYLKVLLLGLRIGVVITIVFALAGPQRIEQNFQKYVLFAVDQSGSVPNGGYDAHKAVLDEALKNKGSNQYAILPFAGKPGAVSSAPLKPGAENNSPLEPLDVSHTDYSKATVLAEAIVPEDSVGEVVIISDFQTAENAPEIHKQINRFGISNHRIDISNKSMQPEICIETVSAPQRARVGQPITVEVLVKSNFNQKAVVAVTLQKNEEAKTEDSAGSQFTPQTIEFSRPGLQSARFEFTPAEAKTYVFEAQLTNAEGTELSDTLPENNRYFAATSVLPQGKVLLVENKKNLAAPLSKALAGEFLTVTPCSADAFPKNLDEFEAVILSNIPATALSDDNQSQLEAYVKSGGGLIALGGDQSFTAGGWHGTTLEELMPVECIPQEKQPRQSLALVLVLDRSESMIEGNAIELSKEAARRALEVLDPTDELGILTYEDNYEWNVPLTQVSDKDAITAKIDAIKAQGRTNLYPALNRACQALDESFSDLKHIIVLTDGVSQPGDFEDLAKQIASKGITMSTVAVGEEADPKILSDLARRCKGSTYICKNPEELPAIFTLETASAAKIGIVERTTKLQTASSLSTLGKFDAGKSPSLLGYVQTQAKPDATVVYSAPAINGVSDPILSWRRYQSKGVIVAFTSDVESRWSRAWLRWNGFGPFWSRLVNFVRRPDSAEQYSVSVDNNAVLVKGDLVQADATCTLTDSAGKTFPMNQAAPGVFKLDSLPALGESKVEIVHNDKSAWTGKVGIVQNYTDEFRPDRSTALAESTLPPVIEASRIFDKSETSVPKTYRYWQYLLWLGVLMTAAEVFLRRTGIA